ncbi:MAG: DUF2161 family putative PD-(D/E)XK-type phosphodiesterase [Candidatus Cloacimonadales bacterium]
MQKIQESDLFLPLQAYLVTAGYEVKAEVNNCDITAIRAEEIIIIELKLSLNLSLILQAVDRQKMADSVYVAVPRPSGKFRRSRLNKLQHLLKRLELGLIFVDLQSLQPVKIIFHPRVLQRQQQNKRKRALLREISLRSQNGNIAGINKRKLLTAYRENAIKIAAYLDVLVEASPAKLRDLGTGTKTQSILSSNFYGWFTRVSRGVYKLNDLGRSELDEEWQELFDIYRAEGKNKQAV